MTADKLCRLACQFTPAKFAKPVLYMYRDKRYAGDHSIVLLFADTHIMSVY